MGVTEWLALATVCFMGAISPGPSLLVVINQTVNRSRLHGIVTAASHGLIVGLWALVTVLGISQVLMVVPFLQTLLTLFAVVYLLFLAQSAWRGGSLKLNLKDVGHRSFLGAAVDGAAIALFNPKLALFFLALFTPFVQQGFGFQDYLLLVLTPWLIDTGWYLFVALALTGRTGLKFLERYQHRINRALAISLTLLAVLMVAGLSFSSLHYE